LTNYTISGGPCIIQYNIVLDAIPKITSFFPATNTYDVHPDSGSSSADGKKSREGSLI
jgi:hypothetical protein